MRRRNVHRSPAYQMQTQCGLSFGLVAHGGANTEGSHAGWNFRTVAGSRVLLFTWHTFFEEKRQGDYLVQGANYPLYTPISN